MHKRYVLLLLGAKGPLRPFGRIPLFFRRLRSAAIRPFRPRVRGNSPRWRSRQVSAARSRPDRRILARDRRRRFGRVGASVGGLHCRRRRCDRRARQAWRSGARPTLSSISGGGGILNRAFTPPGEGPVGAPPPPPAACGERGRPRPRPAWRRRRAVIRPGDNEHSRPNRGGFRAVSRPFAARSRPSSAPPVSPHAKNLYEYSYTLLDTLAV